MTSRAWRIGVVAGAALLAWLCGAVAPADAASGDADGTYTITITRMELSKDGGTTYTTVFSGSEAVNIAAANAGAAVAGLASTSDLTPGNYDTCRTTLGSTLLAKGFVNDGADTRYTNGTGTSTTTGQTNVTGADYAASSYTIPEANRTNTTTFSAPIPVSSTLSAKVIVTFDTSGVLSVTGGLVVPGAPGVTVTAQ